SLQDHAAKTEKEKVNEDTEDASQAKIKLLTSNNTQYFIQHFDNKSLAIIEISRKTVVSALPKSIQSEKFQEFIKDPHVKFYILLWLIEELLICKKIYSTVPQNLILDLIDKVGECIEEAIKEIDNFKDSRWVDLFVEIQNPNDLSSSRGIMFESLFLHIFQVGNQEFETKCVQEEQNSIIKLWFVVPEDIYDDFQSQKYITPKKIIGNDEAYKEVSCKSPLLDNIEQWVVKIKLTPGLV
ncbi:5792_t:CDS:2, partial [Dentiscutata erythropus]